MASATIRSIQPQPIIESVTLELTLEEARTLAVVCAKVGGGIGGLSVNYSPRRHIASVLNTLEDVGIAYEDTPEYCLVDRDMEHYQGIYFNNYPAED